MPEGGEGPAAALLPPYCLGHRVRRDRGSSPGREIVYYDLWPIGIPRPARGRATAAVVCGTCGRSYRCTVSSRARLRWQGRLRGAAGPALVIAGLLAITVLPAFAGPGLVFGMLPVVLCMVGAGWLMTRIAGPGRGVRLRLRGDYRHELRAAGPAVSVVSTLPGPHDYYA